MRRYPAWQASYRSFYSADFYRDVAANWGELGFLHLFLLAFVNCAVFAIMFHIGLLTIIDKLLLPMADQFPTVTSADGKFSINKPCPYVVKEPTSGSPLITFVTSDTQAEPTAAGLYVTPEEVIAVQGAPTEGGPSQVSHLMTAKSLPGILTPQWLKDAILWAKNYLALCVFGAVLIGSTIFLFLQALMYGVIGLIFNAINKTQLSFPQLVRISAVAVTPVLIVETILKAAAPAFLTLPNNHLLFALGATVVTLVYLFIGVNACKTMIVPAHAFTSTSPFESDPLADMNEPLPEPLDSSLGEPVQPPFPPKDDPIA